MILDDRCPLKSSGLTLLAIQLTLLQAAVVVVLAAVTHLLDMQSMSH